MISIFFSVIAIASFVKPHTTRQSVIHVVSSVNASIQAIYTKPCLSSTTYYLLQIILHLVSLVLFLSFIILATVFDDVQDIPFLPVLSKRRHTADIGTSNLSLKNPDIPSASVIEPIRHIPAKISHKTLYDITHHSQPCKRKETEKYERNESVQSDSPFSVPDTKSQEIPPEITLQEKENEQPASVATTPLLTNLPNLHTVSTSSLASSQTLSPDNSIKLTKSMPFHDYHREHPHHPPAIALEQDAPSTRGLHKRSVSTHSLALSISSQKSLSRMGSRVKRAFSKLNRRDGAVFPTHEFDDNNVVSSPDPKKRSSQKGLTRLLKRN